MGLKQKRENRERQMQEAQIAGPRESEPFKMELNLAQEGYPYRFHGRYANRPSLFQKHWTVSLDV